MSEPDPACISYVPGRAETAAGLEHCGLPPERVVLPAGGGQTRSRKFHGAIAMAAVLHVACAAAAWPWIAREIAAPPAWSPTTILIDTVTVSEAAPVRQPATPLPDAVTARAVDDGVTQLEVKASPQPSEPPLKALQPAAEQHSESAEAIPAAPHARPADPAPKPPSAHASKPAPAAASSPATAPRVAAQPDRPQRGLASEATSRASITYPVMVAAHLQRFHRYPNAARAQTSEATVRVSFTLDRSGNVRSAALSQQSASAEFNAAALATVRNASPFPAPPAGLDRLSFVVPLRFRTQ